MTWRNRFDSDDGCLFTFVGVLVVISFWLFWVASNDWAKEKVECEARGGISFSGQSGTICIDSAAVKR